MNEISAYNLSLLAPLGFEKVITVLLSHGSYGLIITLVPNKRVGWKKCELGNIQKKTDKETEKSDY